MKLLAVIITLAISGAFGDAANDSPQTYLISPRRIENIAYLGNDLVEFYSISMSATWITFKKPVNPEHPLIADLTIRSDRKDTLIFDKNGINVCSDQKNGTWEYVAAWTIDTNLLGDEGCDVEPGKDGLTEYAEPSYVNVDKKLWCGSYTMEFYLYSNKNLVMIVNYLFWIDDDCNKN